MYKILYNIDMKVGVFCNRAIKKYEPIQKELIRVLKEEKIAYRVFYSVEEIAVPVDVLIVLGGDGTILKVAIEAGRRGIRLLGINAGNLGFLTEFEGEQSCEAAALLRGPSETEKRSVLEISVNGNKFFALNEAVFHRHLNEEADNSVVAVKAEIDGKKVDNFIGDGVIVSTPTGSTAYSLSAGGPILTPDISAFILTPICAHSLHNRPIVYADSSEMRIILPDGGTSLALYCDGRHIGTVHAEDTVFLRKADFCVEFIKRKNNNFFDKLLIKLNKWSVQQ